MDLIENAESGVMVATFVSYGCGVVLWDTVT